jgi:hypothetical protein
MRADIPPLPQYVFIAWCLVKYRGNFSFTYSMEVVGSRGSSVSIVTMVLAGRLGFDSREGQGYFLCTTACWPVLGSIRWVLGVKRPGHEADHSHLAPRLRMRGAVPTLFIARCFSLLDQIMHFQMFNDSQIPLADPVQWWFSEQHWHGTDVKRESASHGTDRCLCVTGRRVGGCFA